MASGDLLFVFEPPDNTPPTADFARQDYFAAVQGVRQILRFIGSGGSADEEAYFSGVWPTWYGGGGIDFIVEGSSDGSVVTASSFVWGLSVEKTVDGSDQDAGGADFGTETTVSDTPQGLNTLMVSPAGVISHANCGSPAAEDSCRFKLIRDHDAVTNADDAQFQKLIIVES